MTFTSMFYHHFLIHCLVISSWCATDFFASSSSDLGRVDRCNQTQNCRYGSGHCINNKCLYGCEPGRVGNMCNEDCYINHCLECIFKPGQTRLQKCTLCEPGFYGDSCEHVCSQNCLFGSRRCSKEGNCLYGCKPNFQGYNCETQQCDIANCKLCKTVYGHHYCHICEDGMYWNPYLLKCSNCTGNCVGGSHTCNTTTGVCPQGCKQGWFGSNCDLNCTIPNCLKCQEYGYQRAPRCVDCEVGWYKNEGTCKACSRACVGDTNSCNHETGECIQGCILGWYGKKCTKNCTIPNCRVCAETVFDVTYCDQCEKGWYWNYANSTCDQCTHKCFGGSRECNATNGLCLYGCAEGFYGVRCEWSCSTYCVNGSCDSNSGECIHGCIEGWYGPRCDRKCPLHCLQCANFINGVCADCEAGTYGTQCEKKCSQHCERSRYNFYIYCEKDSGRCLHGCIGGYYGDQCNETCSINCYNRICNQTSGHCNTGCNSVWYGQMCDKRCPENCNNPSSVNSRQCDQVSGRCTYGCKTGYYGSYCESSCSDNCYLATCDKKNGFCSNGCKKGYYGFNCSLLCSANCDGNTCSQKNGVCENCHSGFYGEYCNYECFPNCLETCGKVTGFCEGCEYGYHGDRCTQRCVNCFNNTCWQKTGECTLGCMEGTTGTDCLQRCSPGFYGQDCSKSCGQCKDSNPCHTKTGECQLGCDVGWTGETCQEHVQAALSSGQTRMKDNSSTIAVVGSVIAAVLLTVIFIIVVAVFVRRGKMFRLCTKKRSNSQQFVRQDPLIQLQVQQNGPEIVTESTSNAKDLTIVPSDLQIQQALISDGQFYELANGKLYIKQSECPVMVKTLHSDADDMTKQKFYHEINILKTLPNHSNVMAFIGISETNNCVYSVFQHSTASDLLRYLHNLRGSSADLPSAIVRSCLTELLQFSLNVANGLSFLHESEIIHRCIAATNIFLDQNFTAKIGNFHYALMCNNDDETIKKHNEQVSENFTRWMAPEFLKSNVSSYECDIWSFGVFLWEVITLGDTPYERDDVHTLTARIIQGEKLSRPDGCNKRLFRIMSRCWFDNPSQRPSPKQLAIDLGRLSTHTELTDNDITVTTIV